MDTTQDINTVEWFFGYGGNHLGLKRVLPNLRLLAACEIEEFAVENILAKMEAGLLEAAPIWSDCKTFPWEPFVDRTHLFVASYPCQPFSAAGRRQGTEDERHLWPYVYRWILRARPLLVFLENVEGHVSLGLSTVISDLEEGGYKTAWGIFSASEVGAPHQRKRVFILAYDQQQGLERLREYCSAVCWPDERLLAGNGGCREELALTSSLGGAAGIPRPHQGHEGIAGVADHCGDQAWPSRPGEQQLWWEPPRVVVDAKSQRAGQRSELRSEECGSRSALPWDVEQSGEGAVANDYSAHAGHGEQRPERTLGDLSGGCGEAGPMEYSNDACRWQEMSEREAQGRAAAGWTGEALGNSNSPRPQERPRQRGSAIQGADADGGEAAGRQTQPPLGRDADGPADWLDDAELYTTCDNRTDELRLLGNGVVPATAERAFRVLVGELIQHANQ